MARVKTCVRHSSSRRLLPTRFWYLGQVLCLAWFRLVVRVALILCAGQIKVSSVGRGAVGENLDTTGLFGRIKSLKEIRKRRGSYTETQSQRMV